MRRRKPRHVLFTDNTEDVTEPPTLAPDEGRSVGALRQTSGLPVRAMPAIILILRLGRFAVRLRNRVVNLERPKAP